mmetsp:Transcript_62112/g.161396  ORF Transcript_62112/g.161396 Transcript_62112/m.161396 type:complete len:307 (+) Transcript_62112:125-1045(+)
MPASRARAFVSVQGGRKARDALEEDRPWGTTASSAHYRAYDQVEQSNCRDNPLAATVSEQFRRSRSSPGAVWGARGAPPVSVGGHVEAAAPDLGRLRGRATPTARSISGRSLHSSTGSLPRAPAAAARLGAIPESGRRTHNQELQARAQEARHRHMPGLDETVPRSERLPLEMALAGCSRQSVRSASTADDDCSSIYTLESSATGGSCLGQAYTSSRRPMVKRISTADSSRLHEQPGGIARYRAQAQRMAPMQWAPDRAWLEEQWDKNGCAGLCTANFVPRNAPELRAYDNEVVIPPSDSVARALR